MIMHTVPLDLEIEVTCSGWTNAELDVGWPGGFANIYASDASMHGFEMTDDERDFLLALINRTEHLEAERDGDHNYDEEREIELRFWTVGGKFVSPHNEQWFDVTRIVRAADADDFFEAMLQQEATL